MEPASVSFIDVKRVERSKETDSAIYRVEQHNEYASCSRGTLLLDVER